MLNLSEKCNYNSNLVYRLSISRKDLPGHTGAIKWIHTNNMFVVIAERDFDYYYFYCPNETHKNLPLHISPLNPSISYIVFSVMMSPRGFRGGVLNWRYHPIFLVSSFRRQPLGQLYALRKLVFPFPYTLNGIWLWGQISFRFWTKWNSIWFKIKRKTVTTIISHSMWKEMEI